LSRAHEAERLLRDCLAIRQRGTNVNHWQTAETKTRPGGAVLAVAVIDPALDAAARQSKLTEAETLLLEGNEQLQQSKSVDREFQRDALERLVRLYEAWHEIAPHTGKAEQAQVWKHKLEAFRAGDVTAFGKAKGE